MTIKRYISVLVVLAVGVFLVNASLPEAALAKGVASSDTSRVQCNAPANSWCVPATSANGTPGTFCATCAPNVSVPAPVKPACQVVQPPDTAWQALGSVLEIPFVLGQCLIGGCPPPPCRG